MPASILLGLGLLAVIGLAAIAVVVAFLSESDKWVRVTDPNMIDLMEKIENLPDYKRDTIEDIADDS